MPKKSLDIMRWWPLMMALFTLVSSSAVLYYRVKNLEDRIEKNEKKADKNMERFISIGEGVADLRSDMKERFARMEGAKRE